MPASSFQLRALERNIFSKQWEAQIMAIYKKQQQQQKTFPAEPTSFIRPHLLECLIFTCYKSPNNERLLTEPANNSVKLQYGNEVFRH